MRLVINLSLSVNSTFFCVIKVITFSSLTPFFEIDHILLWTLLGFKDSPKYRSKILPHPDKIEDEAPKYMLDLYERFKNNQIAKGSLRFYFLSQRLVSLENNNLI
jgi:hypothetical protein